MDMGIRGRGRGGKHPEEPFFPETILCASDECGSGSGSDVA